MCVYVVAVKGQEVNQDEKGQVVAAGLSCSLGKFFLYFLFISFIKLIV